MVREVSRWLIRNEGEGTLFIQARDTGLAHTRRYHVQKERLSVPFGHGLPPLLEDLVDLALTVYSADRLILRRPPKAESDRRWWQRHFEIHLPVSSPERWMQPEIRQSISEALGFLTEDHWEFTFSPRRPSLEVRSVQRVLFPPEPPVTAALFSGGLDSLAGLAIQLAQESMASLVVVTCSTNSRLLRRQRQLLEQLHRRAGVRLIPIIMPLRLRQNHREYNQNERSQRSRGFLFGVLGCVACVMAGGGDLAVYENGVGALNLPISAAQLGAQSSRSSHPLALWKLERFLRSVLEKDFRLRLPFLFTTKGEMCDLLHESPFSDLALQTISCDGFPMRLPGPEQCGICTSCLLRRQALWTSGFEEDCDGGRYRRDVLTTPEAMTPDQLAPLWDMLGQVNTMEQALDSMTPWSSLTVEYPELLEVPDVVRDWLGLVPRAEIETKLTDLYRSYCREWRQFPAQPPGWMFSTPDLRMTA